MTYWKALLIVAIYLIIGGFILLKVDDWFKAK